MKNHFNIDLPEDFFTTIKKIINDSNVYDESIYESVKEEIDRQRKIHGDSDYMLYIHENPFAPITVIAEELGELSQEILDRNLDRAIFECVQLTACGWAMLRALTVLKLSNKEGI